MRIFQIYAERKKAKEAAERAKAEAAERAKAEAAERAKGAERAKAEEQKAKQEAERAKEAEGRAKAAEWAKAAAVSKEKENYSDRATFLSKRGFSTKQIRMLSPELIEQKYYEEKRKLIKEVEEQTKNPEFPWGRIKANELHEILETLKKDAKTPKK